MTLTGAGGVGKTRLALEAARRPTARAGGGVWLVDLVTVAPGADVAGETARILHIDGETGDAAREALSRSLGDRHALLGLDNCEHVIERCAELASALLAPSIVVPAHCTGWRAQHAIGARFGEGFIPNTVGTRFEL